MGRVRLLPLLALAAICLTFLKAAGLLFSGGYMLTGPGPASAQIAEQQPENPQPAPVAVAQLDQRPSPSQATVPDPESAAAQPAASDEQVSRQAAGPATPDPGPVQQTPGPDAALSGSELDVLKSLSKRRKVLDQTAKDLQARENLLRAAEQRVSARIAELKAIEQRIEAELTKKDRVRDAEYTKLVTLYSKMKPKKAAKIFDRLEIGVLTDLVRRMKPKTISPIFAAMNPSVAERVTMEIARQDQQPAPDVRTLPKIDGKTPG